jgi:hypothetical protein
MGLLYGRAGRSTAQNGGFRRGQFKLAPFRPEDRGTYDIAMGVKVIQPLVELYGDCMVVLKVSRRGIDLPS